MKTTFYVSQPKFVINRKKKKKKRKTLLLNPFMNSNQFKSSPNTVKTFYLKKANEDGWKFQYKLPIQNTRSITIERKKNSKPISILKFSNKTHPPNPSSASSLVQKPPIIRQKISSLVISWKYANPRLLEFPFESRTPSENYRASSSSWP